MLNLREAAERVGRNPVTVRQWLNRKTDPLPALAVTKEGDKLPYQQARLENRDIVSVLIDPADLDRFQPRPTGPKRDRT